MTCHQPPQRSKPRGIPIRRSALPLQQASQDSGVLRPGSCNICLGIVDGVTAYSLVGYKWQIPPLNRMDAGGGKFAIYGEICTHTHTHIHIHTHACSIPCNTLPTEGVDFEYLPEQSSGPAAQTAAQPRSRHLHTQHTDTRHIQRLVLGAHYNLGSTKSSLSISEHLGVTSH